MTMLWYTSIFGLILYHFTHCDDLLSVVCLILLLCKKNYLKKTKLCVSYTAISHNGMNKVFCILYPVLTGLLSDTAVSGVRNGTGQCTKTIAKRRSRTHIS